MAFFVCQRTPQKIKFRFSERWQKKNKSVSRALEICAAKIQCVDLFPDTFNFLQTWALAERLFLEAPNIMTDYRAKCFEAHNFLWCRHHYILHNVIIGPSIGFLYIILWGTFCLFITFGISGTLRIVWACPLPFFLLFIGWSGVGLCALSFVRSSQKDAAAIPHA